MYHIPVSQCVCLFTFGVDEDWDKETLWVNKEQKAFRTAHIKLWCGCPADGSRSKSGFGAEFSLVNTCMELGNSLHFVFVCVPDNKVVFPTKTFVDLKITAVSPKQIGESVFILSVLVCKWQWDNTTMLSAFSPLSPEMADGGISGPK